MELEVEHTRKKKTPSLALAITLSVISFILVFIAFTGKDFGISNIPKIIKYPEVFQSYLAQAVGGSLALPMLIVMLLSFFKSKRNPTTRRKIFISCSLLIIFVEIITIFYEKA